MTVAGFIKHYNKLSNVEIFGNVEETLPVVKSKISKDIGKGLHREIESWEVSREIFQLGTNKVLEPHGYNS